MSAAPAMDDAPPCVRSLQHAFAEARARHPGQLREAAYTFAGRPVVLRIVGARLAERIQRPFAHLRRRDRAADPLPLQIDLWDEAETGVPFPADGASPELEQQWLACDGLLRASSDGRYVSFQYQDSITLLDRRGQRMIGCRRNGSHLSRGECSKPFVVMLTIWYSDRGVQILHAGLIARRGAGVLMPGESGSGKSTTSLAGVAQGLEFLADDFVGLERVPGDTFRGHSLFSTACLTRAGLGRFADVQRHAVEDRFPEEEKPILFLAEIYPDRLIATVPIHAIALLRIGAERTEIQPASRPEALRQFAASTLHTVVPRPGRAALEMMAELVERVPAYWLLLGPDTRDVPEGIERILACVEERGRV
ncbi:MAG: hypothetical protein ABI780_12945 [Ardenticatenales bacterium]